MRLWRIAGASHAVWSGDGARLFGGRWNPVGQPAVYAGTSYAIAMLEILVHANLTVPPARLRYVQADMPDGVSVERAEAMANFAASQAFGGAWLRERRSFVLLVPSMVTNGLDWNAVLNPLHPDFSSVVVSGEAAVAWDARLRHDAGPLLEKAGGAGTAPPTMQS